MYAAREGQKIEHVPLDARLGLPEGEFSYVLMDWLQRLCVKESFREAATDLRALLNLAPSERAAEQMNQHLAQDAEIFQTHQSPPEPATEGELLVATADGKGEKANKKQMAYVGAVYSINRLPRSAADVVDDSPEAATFVSHRLTMLFKGKVGRVIGGLRRLATRHTLRGEKLKRLNAAITSYENNRGHMQYDEYLAAGYPIGSGVAEGACRHLVKDRMEGTGMRWTAPGAQAMLRLRAVYLNGRWNKFIEYHAETEQDSLYGKAAA